MQHTITVSSADFQRNFGRYQDEVFKGPIEITRNGRVRTALLSVDEYREYQRLKQQERKVGLTREMSEQQLAALAASKAPDEFSKFDQEFDGGGP